MEAEFQDCGRFFSRARLGKCAGHADLAKAMSDSCVLVGPMNDAELRQLTAALDDTEHQMLPFIEKFRSMKEAVQKFGRI